MGSGSTTAMLEPLLASSSVAPAAPRLFTVSFDPLGGDAVELTYLVQALVAFVV